MMNILSIFLVFLTLKCNVIANVAEDSSALQYLAKFGYTDKSFISNRGSLIDVEVLTNSLAEFQRFNRLPITGRLDNATRSLMQRPRCGLPDPVNPSGQPKPQRSKRYAFFGPPWTYRNLTYNFGRYSSYARNLSRYEAEQEITRAFNEWSRVTNLTFTRSSVGNVDIEIRFEEGHHGNGICDPFDGPGLVLAHAYAPGPDVGGDVHFDDAETWTRDSVQGRNLFSVALHEIGHSLGLGHSNVPGSVMYAYMLPYNADLQLTEDDIKGIQSVYPGNYGTTETSETKTQMPPIFNYEPPRPTIRSPSRQNIPSPNITKPEICRDPKVDAILPLLDQSLIFFKNDEYYKIIKSGDNYTVAPGYPLKVTSRWPKLETPIDAALFSNNRHIFFKGRRYWQYNNYKLISGFPKRISEGWPHVQNNLDAALLWYDGVVWFFKGKNYYEYERTRIHGTRRLSIERKPISNLYLPVDKIDAAFTIHQKASYFFSGTEFYEWNQIRNRNTSLPSKSIGSYWFGCSSLNLFEKISIKSF